VKEYGLKNEKFYQLRKRLPNRCSIAYKDPSLSPFEGKQNKASMRALKEAISRTFLYSSLNLILPIIK
jgi:hypothetical protein